MLIQGFPVAVALSSDPSFKDRFWYWSGASGRKYIHTVYRPDDCPPLPGAVYVAVKRRGSLRIAVSVGRFGPLWDQTIGSREMQRFRRLGIDELHVHLPGQSPARASAVLQDLREAFTDSEAPAFTSPPSAPVSSSRAAASAAA